MSVALALVGLGAIFIGIQYGDGTLHGGHLFPLISGGAVALLAVTMLFDRYVEETGNALGWKTVAFLGLTSIFLLVMPVVGYPLVAPVWLIGLMATLGLRNPLLLTVTGFALPAVAWFLLDELAHAPPPLGVLGEIL
ncbi:MULTISPECIES: tripartite tricarboxylate transporter TctB family protein [unclassified Labrenzia]|uniref:tripartite tricarboxylate transporter TctB family protein n=1 Tax=unclassified Labrenzia TaxID=2648686 RepID=UPI0004AD2119|nr:MULTISPECIES: tripartite tricarboxylate transporter TctB family protein [unclassified Labrenzia]